MIRICTKMGTICPNIHARNGYLLKKIKIQLIINKSFSDCY